MQVEDAWKPLFEHYEQVKGLKLKKLLQDEGRNKQLVIPFSDLILDLTHEKLTPQTLDLLVALAESSGLDKKVEKLFNGDKINVTENRSVLHTCLRAPIDSEIHNSVGHVMKDVHEVLGNIKVFSEKVRKGELKGATGKDLTNLIVIGIGGSYLSIQFVYQALKCHPDYAANSKGRTLRFLANVDPIDIARATQDLNPEETLILINSKTFTTAETILNAKSCKQWLINHYKQKNINDVEAIAKSHICACSTNLEQTSKFGIAKENVFGFWDFVGGRFSVWSAIGVVPLAIHFGYHVVEEFLKGGHEMDKHFLLEKNTKVNVPRLLGLIGFFRTTIQNYSARAIVPYCQALCKFAPHIQQLDMESNGKRISLEGERIQYETAVVNFGEPGTNGQHSFFQLLHQGRTIPIEFIGFTKSQNPVNVEGEPVNNHDELMSNFFSQPDALAIGKDIEQLKEENVPEHLLTHKQFPGDRPSSSLLFLGELNAFKCGELLALYEHRTSVEGFLWNVNSYDQWGVELGKVLAKKVRSMLSKGEVSNELNPATKSLLQQYMSNK